MIIIFCIKKNLLKDFRGYHKMNRIIIIIFFAFSSISLGQDYACPKEVNFGDFIIIDSASNISPSIQYLVSFKAVKQSESDVIYHDSKLKILYDSTIFANGNLFNITNYLFYKDTILFRFLITPSYFDEISQRGKYLKAKFTFYYRRLHSYNLDSQEVLLKYRLIQDKRLLVNNIFYNSYYLNLKKYFGNINDSSAFLSYIYNNSDRIFFIDSLKQNIDGINFFSFSRLKEDTLPFPLKLLPGQFFYFYHKFKLLRQENSRSIINILGHFDNSAENIILKDTISVIFDYYDSLLVTSNFNYLPTYNNDTNRIPYIRIQNFQDSSLLLKRMNIVNYDDLNLFFINKSGFELPYLFEPWSVKTLKTIYIVPTEIKKYKINVELYFVDYNGKEFTRELEFIINSIEKPVTSIQNFNPTSFSIAPNPATDYIEISLDNHTLNGEVKNVKIYDVLGQCVMTGAIHPMTRSHRMNIESLPAGVYFVRVGGQVLKFVKL